MIVTIVTMTMPIFIYMFVKFDLKDLEGGTLTVRPKGVRSTVKSQGNESKNIKRSGYKALSDCSRPTPTKTGRLRRRKS